MPRSLLALQVLLGTLTTTLLQSLANTLKRYFQFFTFVAFYDIQFLCIIGESNCSSGLMKMCELYQVTC